MATEEADDREKSLENPMFSIQTLRQPYHKLDHFTQEQVKKTAGKHKMISEKFLNEQIKTRIIIFIEDEAKAAPDELTS